MWNQPTSVLIDLLRSAGVRRGYVVCDPQDGSMRAGPSALQPLADTLQEQAGQDFDRHLACFFEIGRNSDHLLGAFLHRTQRGPGSGGIRYWHYDSLGEYLRDGLRLSQGMARKNALAGLWWGGGKGVIARRRDTDPKDQAVRSAVYGDYGRFLSSLRGCYVGAEDVGTTPADMALVFRHTRHTTCIPPALGGSGNPSVLTARGVVVAMEAALDYLSLGSLAGKTLAMQGLGHVSCYMLEELFARGVSRVVAVDVNPDAVAKARQSFASRGLEAHTVAPGNQDILAQPCDILVPNAVGGILSPKTIPSMNTPIVCGAANNQLLNSQRDGTDLRARGIVYVPDFLANRMGIVNCANEAYGVFPEDPAVTAHLQRDSEHGIYQRCMEVFRRSASSNRSTAEEADLLADELLDELHPVWGNRSAQIVRFLIDNGWQEGHTDPPGLEEDFDTASLELQALAGLERGSGEGSPTAVRRPSTVALDLENLEEA